MEKDSFPQVGADHGVVWFGTPDEWWPDSGGIPSRMTQVHQSKGFFLFTATHTGPVGVKLIVGEQPDGLDLRGWEAESFEVELPSTLFAAIPIMGAGDSPEVQLPSAGRYAVTVLGTERVEPAEDLEFANERYLVLSEPQRFS